MHIWTCRACTSQVHPPRLAVESGLRVPYAVGHIRISERAQFPAQHLWEFGIHANGFPAFNSNCFSGRDLGGQLLHVLVSLHSSGFAEQSAGGVWNRGTERNSCSCGWRNRSRRSSVWLRPLTFHTSRRELHPNRSRGDRRCKSFLPTEGNRSPADPWFF